MASSKPLLSNQPTKQTTPTLPNKLIFTGIHISTTVCGHLKDTITVDIRTIPCILVVPLVGER